MKYFCKRTFAHPTENRLTRAGEKIKVSESTSKQMIAKGLITPAYKTKEDKEKIRVTMEHTGGGWYRVMHGKKEIAKMRKKEAEAYKEKHD